MARRIRIEYAGATYHVMARGNQGRDIYADEADRKVWLQTLAEACARTGGWRIHAWVMMGNHYHLLLETPEPNLVVGMKWLQGAYTQRYNSRHGLFCVTQAIRWVNGAAELGVERLRGRLERAYETAAPAEV